MKFLLLIIVSVFVLAFAEETGKCYDASTGKYYAEGESIKMDCNTCSCSTLKDTASWVCTEMACIPVITCANVRCIKDTVCVDEPTGPVCKPACSDDGGSFFAAGESIKKVVNGTCQSCTCSSSTDKAAAQICTAVVCEDNCGGACKNNQVCEHFPVQCIRAPCPQYRCKNVDECDCKEGETCVKAPKVCKTTPCPQYECKAPEVVSESDGESKTSSGNEDSKCICKENQVCVYSPKECITTPCPQYECKDVEPTDKCDCKDNEICVPAPKECITTPCPQFECKAVDECDCKEDQICVKAPKACIREPCPQYECQDKKVGCLHPQTNEFFGIGESAKGVFDDCNTCQCMASDSSKTGGIWGCTKIACPVLTCANVLCIAERRCVDGPNGPRCVPFCLSKDNKFVDVNATEDSLCNSCRCTPRLNSASWVCLAKACKVPVFQFTVTIKHDSDEVVVNKVIEALKNLDVNVTQNDDGSFSISVASSARIFDGDSDAKDAVVSQLESANYQVAEVDANSVLSESSSDSGVASLAAPLVALLLLAVRL